jgi:hypothetical protein
MGPKDKDRQYNGQKIKTDNTMGPKDKRTNNVLQNTTHKTKDRPRTPQIYLIHFRFYVEITLL